jgi:hypothetical protein
MDDARQVGSGQTNGRKGADNGKAIGRRRIRHNDRRGGAHNASTQQSNKSESVNTMRGVDG